jgi:hypothetical protein
LEAIFYDCFWHKKFAFLVADMLRGFFHLFSNNMMPRQGARCNTGALAISGK